MLSDELKRARKALDMTQGELAEALGLTGTFIGMMERGERAIEQRTGMAVRHLLLQDYLRRTRTDLHTRIEALLAVNGDGASELPVLKAQLDQISKIDHLWERLATPTDALSS